MIGGVSLQPAAAVPRTTTVRYFVTAEAHKYWHAFTHCPSGMLATGGGGGGGSSEVRLVSTQAIDGGTGWDVTIANPTDHSVVFSVYAICYSGLTNYQVRTETAAAAPNDVSNGWSDCTLGGKVLGGGVWADTYNVSLREMSASQPRNAYFGQLRNWDSVPRTMTIQTICANGITPDAFVTDLYEDVAPGQNGISEATCPPNRTIISGGPLGSSTVMSIPDPQPDVTKWMISVRNETSSTERFAATVLCGI
ncbi:hypothetical protein GCM10009554_40490 [Kribbella koreensis]|uniref:Secreted protein n=2 Tax=Kribbella koreensis TaxID=57909 RepID=A0ABP4B3G8_9ACTN